MNLCFFIQQRADLAITDLTITSDRVSAIDFTPSFMNLGKLNKMEINFCRTILM